MLRLLVNSGFRTNLGINRNCNTFHQLTSKLKPPSNRNFTLKAEHLKWTRPQNGGATKTQSNASKLLSLVFGGTGISCCLILQNRNLFVHCESSRLNGRKAANDDGKDTKFDWARFWSYLRPHILKLLASICAALAVAYFNIKIPNMLGELVNTLSKFIGPGEAGAPKAETSFMRSMSGPAFRLFSLYAAQSLFTFIYILLLSQIGEQMAAQLRQDLFKQIVIQDMSFFDENRTGELVNRLTADVQDFKHSFKQCVSQGLRSLAQLIGGAVSLVLISPHLAGIALVSVPTAVLIGSMLGQSLRKLSKDAQAQSERATSVCEEALANIRTVRSNASEFAEVELFEKETNKSAVISQQLGVGIAVFQSLTNMFLNCMVLSTLYLGGHLMSVDSLSPGQLMAFLVASQGVQRSLSQGSILMGSMIRGMSAGTRVFEYLSIAPNMDLVQGLVIPNYELQGEIRFENVQFSYPSRPDQVVLKNFSLVLKPGQTVALVGSSGSGKSTVAGLLERFYDPTEGTIYLDGYNLKDVSPMWLRGEIIGFIEQQPILFGTTIFENIKYGRPDAIDAEIYECARQSQSHEFIEGLPGGYGTNVGERGTQLSGGQRQRIAIARALLKQPLILILDEATSALDANSEAVVQKALDDAVANRTTLVIAHRLSTIKNADVIVVLDHGNIVEVGTHENLMRNKGRYFDLVRTQERREKEGHADSKLRGQG